MDREPGRGVGERWDHVPGLVQIQRGCDAGLRFQLSLPSRRVSIASGCQYHVLQEQKGQNFDEATGKGEAVRQTEPRPQHGSEGTRDPWGRRRPVVHGYEPRWAGISSGTPRGCRRAFRPPGARWKILSNFVYGQIFEDCARAYFGVDNADVYALRTVQDTVAAEDLLRVGATTDHPAVEELCREQRTGRNVSELSCCESVVNVTSCGDTYGDVWF